MNVTYWQRRRQNCWMDHNRALDGESLQHERAACSCQRTSRPAWRPSVSYPCLVLQRHNNNYDYDKLYLSAVKNSSITTKHLYTLFWRFDLITRSSSEEAGTQFFRVLNRLCAAAMQPSAKWVCGHETLEDIEGFIGAPKGPKDKQDKEDITECVYKVPCANCDKTYVGETERKLGVRLHET